jgi:Glucodextranase, domain B/FecR protein
MNRRSAYAAWAALLLAGCGWCAPPVPKPAAPSAPAYVPMAGLVAVELSAAQGEVQVRRSSSGPWGPARLPISLGFDDSVRTGTGGAATLKVGREGTIELRERTEVSVRQLLANRARFRLERGRVGATPGGTSVAVESSGSSAVAEATTGSFAVFNDGRGLVAVVADAGEVKLASNGGDTMLAAGQGARVVGDSAPVPEAVPRSVLLKVAWPEEKVTRALNVTVRGEADPGAVVAVNGVKTRIEADGHFETDVPLAPGINHVSITTTDRFGRTVSAEETVRVERRAPPLKAEHEGWQ